MSPDWPTYMCAVCKSNRGPVCDTQQHSYSTPYRGTDWYTHQFAIVETFSTAK